MKKIWKDEKNCGNLMSEQRFIDIQQCTRGFGQDGRNGCNDFSTWFERGQTRGQLHDLESCIFERSVEILLNKRNGSIVIDDELISSKATDVESKIVSARKTGKEGPVTDNIACSLSSVMIAMKLRTKGTSQEKNVEHLLNKLPVLTATGDTIEVAFDRGYGKFSSVSEISKRNLDVLTIASTIGARHPFITSNEWSQQTAKWRIQRLSANDIQAKENLCSSWILDNADMLGTDVRIACRSIPPSKKVFALALRDVFDRR
jgi:hypothetical protein